MEEGAPTVTCNGLTETSDGLLEFTGISRTVLETRIRMLVRLLDKIEKHPDIRGELFLDIHTLIEQDVRTQLAHENGV